MTDEREQAWGAVHEAPPARWTVGHASVADPLRGTWQVAAIAPHPSRGKIPQYVVGEGPDEVSVLRDLDALALGPVVVLKVRVWSCFIERAKARRVGK